MSSNVNIGIIGLRNIGTGHARRAAGLAGCEVVACADTDIERAQAAADLYKSARVYTSADELLDDERVDAVVLALPNHLHAPLTIQALAAGKHVLVEKPMAMTSQEAREMIAARDVAGKVLMVGMNQRFVPGHQAVKAAIDDGTIGEIYAAKTGWLMCRVGSGLWGRGNWFLQKETAGGGPVLDLGVHRLDLALYLMGFPRVVSVDAVSWQSIGRKEGRKHNKAYTIEDGGVGLVRFENGASLVLEASYFWNGISDGQVTELAGTKGGVLLAGDCKIQNWTTDEPEDIPVVIDDTRATSCIEHFVRVLHGEEELIPTAEQGLVSMQIIEAFYHSAEIGQQVHP